MESLDAILKGKQEPINVVERPEPKEAPEVKAETPETPEQKAERERDDKGRFKAKAEGETPAQPETPKAEATPKVEKPATPTVAEKKLTVDDPEAEPLDPKARAYYAKAKDEQRKRQAVERELQALRAAQQPQQQIDPVQDPRGYAERIAQQAELGAVDRILNFSEAVARRTYGDDVVTEAQEAFREAAMTSPHLYQQLHSQPDPYDWLIKQHKREKFLREVTDPDEWKKQQREALRKEVEAEFAQKQPVARPAAPVPTPSLANAQSTGAISTAPTYDGPTPFSKILRR